MDVYTFYMASEQVEDPVAKKELIDVSDWLKTTSPVFSKAWASKIDEFIAIMQNSIDACVEFE